MVPEENPAHAKALEALGEIEEKLQTLEIPLEKHLDTRRDFFDKVVVLAGGTIALTVTMLSSVAGKNIYPHALLAIKASWSLLTLALILAVLRNWLDPEQRIHSRMTGTVDEVRRLGVKLLQAVKPDAVADF